MRRIMAALLALLLLSPVALSESYAFVYTGGAAAVDESGVLLVPPGLYDDIRVLYADDGTLKGYAAGITSGGGYLYKILSPAGGALTDFLYASVEAAGDSFICQESGAYRIVSSSGVPGADAYTAIAYAGEGAFLTLSNNVNDEIADPLTLLAANGIKWQLGIYALYGLGTFSDDLMPLCAGGSVLFGYIGRDGTWKIPAQYEYAGDFEDGYAVVSTRAGFGVIDSAGAYAVEADCDFIDRNGGRILALVGGVYTLYKIGADGLTQAFAGDTDGASPRLSGESVVLYASGGVSVLDDAGDVLFTASPTASVSAAGGLYVVRDGDWDDASTCLVDSSGVQISAKYNTIRFLEGEGASALFAYGVMAEDSYDMKFGLLRGDGTIVADLLYDELAQIGPNLFCAVSANGAALIDGTGNLITPLD